MRIWDIMELNRMLWDNMQYNRMVVELFTKQISSKKFKLTKIFFYGIWDAARWDMGCSKMGYGIRNVARWDKGCSETGYGI